MERTSRYTDLFRAVLDGKTTITVETNILVDPGSLNPPAGTMEAWIVYEGLDSPPTLALFGSAGT